MTVDDSAQIMLRHQISTFPTLDAVVYFLFKPVLFPRHSRPLTCPVEDMACVAFDRAGRRSIATHTFTQ